MVLIGFKMVDQKHYYYQFYLPFGFKNENEMDASCASSDVWCVGVGIADVHSMVLAMINVVTNRNYQSIDDVNICFGVLAQWWLLGWVLFSVSVILQSLYFIEEFETIQVAFDVQVLSGRQIEVVCPLYTLQFLVLILIN